MILEVHLFSVFLAETCRLFQMFVFNVRFGRHNSHATETVRVCVVRLECLFCERVVVGPVWCLFLFNCVCLRVACVLFFALCSVYFVFGLCSCVDIVSPCCSLCVSTCVSVLCMFSVVLFEFVCVCSRVCVCVRAYDSEDREGPMASDDKERRPEVRKKKSNRETTWRQRYGGREDSHEKTERLTTGSRSSCSCRFRHISVRLGVPTWMQGS